MAMLEVRNLSKTYGDTQAVRGISFDLPEGEVLGFLGPNGAGKSTTMRVITGFTPPTAGTVRVGGHDVVRDPYRVRALLGYLPESAPVHGEMTVRGYVSFFAEAKGLYGRSRREAVERALGECGLAHVAGRLLMNLSKGYRQRAALAQAVVGDPRLLVLDEPTVGLDPAQIHEIRELIKAMAGRRTVILSTHILPEVSLSCTRVLIIRRGRVMAEGAPGNLHARVGAAENRLRLRLRGEDGALAVKLEAIAGLREARREDTPEAGAGEALWRIEAEGDADPRGEIARAVVESGLELLELHAETLSLEEVFLRTVAGDMENEGATNHA